MFRPIICFFIVSLLSLKIAAQTTDLSIVIEAQNTSGTPISQASIYQDFQYIITIINSGNAVSNATFSQDLNPNISFIEAVSFNTSGGASLVSNLIYDQGTLTGTMATLPSDRKSVV